MTSAASAAGVQGSGARTDPHGVSVSAEGAANPDQLDTWRRDACRPGAWENETFAKPRELVLHALTGSQKTQVMVDGKACPGLSTDPVQVRDRNDNGRPVLQFVVDFNPENIVCVCYFRGSR
jgi:hypothetical protein